jgi:catechol 2,3-dioxygenase-like lactoylglutathione lyase family enzyme
MFDHVGFRVRDVEASRKFYLSALAPLGFGGKPELWLAQGGSPASLSPSPRQTALKSTPFMPPRSHGGRARLALAG